MPDYHIRPLTGNDKTMVVQFIVERWGIDLAVGHGMAYQPSSLPGFIAIGNNEQVVGLLTYTLADNSCEIVTIDSTLPGQGIGTALIEVVKELALQQNCQRLWLITTNDNINALRFYQKRGFVLVAIHRNALAQSRKIKPQIPLIGDHGIPLRDEIELEIPLRL
jgi:ribosomal protein S18 acetylase RimI-like enzyme